MLQRKNLTSITQGRLRKQPDFGEAIQDHPLRLDRLERFENPAGGFAEFQVRRIQQTLLLLIVEQALGRDQLE